MKKNELFYFSASDLMVRIVIDEEKNVAKYQTHRPINYGERVLIEKYISEKVLNIGDFYKNPEVNEMGIDKDLMKDYNDFQSSKNKKILNETFEELHKKDKNITAAIVSLCEAANKEFWFNRLGDILRDRNENHADDQEYRLQDLREAIAEYNKTVEKAKQVNIMKFVTF